MNDIQLDRDEVPVESLSIIQRLADEFRVSVDQVLPLYERELTSLRSKARVTAYLSVLTTKHVRDVLHDMQSRAR